jgi:hypothetical protein
MATEYGRLPVAKSTLAPRSEVVILPLVGLNVGLKNWVLYAAKLVSVFKTVIAPYLAPVGTVTVKLVSVALLTVARVAPKNTMLLAAVLLKPVPVRVTVAATLALVGVKEVMVGGDNVPVLGLLMGKSALCANPIWEVKNRLRMEKHLRYLVRLAIM